MATARAASRPRRPSSASGVDGYLAAADIDRDGDTDLVVASTSTQSVDLLLNDGSGRFAAPVSTVLTAAPWGLAVADFDQDGWVDVAVARADDTVQVLWNRGGVSGDPGRPSPWPRTARRAPCVGTVTATGTVPLTFAITAGQPRPRRRHPAGLRHRQPRPAPSPSTTRATSTTRQPPAST